MNDPLKDNRIFPEEMQQKAPRVETKKTNLSWLWLVIGIILLGVLVWYGYQTYLNNKSQNDIPTLKEQQDIFKAIQTQTPITPEEQDEKIEFFFGEGGSIY